MSMDQLIGFSREKIKKEVEKLVKLVERLKVTLPGTEEYMRLGKEILTINVKNLFAIGTVGEAPKPVIIKNTLRNTPKDGVWGWDYRFWLPYQADQWFFKK